MKTTTLTLLLFCLISPIWAQVSAEADVPLKPETFQMQWGDSTITMQKYFMVFLKSGTSRTQSEEEALKIQQQHLDYLSKMYEEGHTSMTGPTGDDSEIRGFVVYNTATLEQARKLAEQDPAVQADLLEVEVHPWWAAKGSTLQ